MSTQALVADVECDAGTTACPPQTPCPSGVQTWLLEDAVSEVRHRLVSHGMKQQAYENVGDACVDCPRCGYRGIVAVTSRGSAIHWLWLLLGVIGVVILAATYGQPATLCPHCRCKYPLGASMRMGRISPDSVDQLIAHFLRERRKARLAGGVLATLVMLLIILAVMAVRSN
jgi:hypothetical protein